MPDAGDFEKNSASASPDRWGDAFAALPVETPAAAGWERLQARLPAGATPRVRRRWPLWLATAAALALVMVVPLRMLPPTKADPIAPAVEVSTASISTPSVVTVAPAVSTPIDADPPPAFVTVANRNKPSRPSRIAPAQRPVRTAAEPAGTTRLASEEAARQRIESLHADSAQLEQLLAMVRDERVANATTVALSSEFDARIAGIDDALAQSGLDAATRDRLWQQRVDALQQLVGIETTNRLLSARGERFNASLVSID